MLRSATLTGSKYLGVLVNIGAHGQREGLGLDQEIGSLEKGKLADLIVMDKNPLEEIRNTESVRYTMVNGRLYDSETMDEIAPRSVKRQPFFWEDGKAPRLPANTESHD